jgi:hypothetical protein
MPADECKQRLRTMLQREEEMRLHLRVQEMYGSIGEDEDKRLAAQTYIAFEYNVDPIVGIELLRSAATLDFSRHCSPGSLRQRQSVL